MGKPEYKVDAPKMLCCLLFQSTFKSCLAHLFQGNLSLKGSVKLCFFFSSNRVCNPGREKAEMGNAGLLSASQHHLCNSQLTTSVMRIKKRLNIIRAPSPLLEDGSNIVPKIR